MKQIKRTHLPIGAGVVSSVLSELAADTGRERLSVGDILDSFGDRALGTMIFVFAIPNVMPIGIPGMSMALGLPLLVLSWRLAIGRHDPWLPSSIRARSFKRADFTKAMDRILPRLSWLESKLRPRYTWLSGAFSGRVIGWIGVVLSLMISLPIPFGNALPGVSLAVLAIGHIEKDGLIIVLGGFLTLLSFITIGVVLVALGYTGFLITEALH